MATIYQKHRRWYIIFVRPVFVQRHFVQGVFIQSISSNPIRLGLVRIERNGFDENLGTKMNWKKSRSTIIQKHFSEKMHNVVQCSLGLVKFPKQLTERSNHKLYSTTRHFRYICNFPNNFKFLCSITLQSIEYTLTVM